MEVLQHFSHVHPLVFINEERSHKNEEINCYACGEPVSGPRFSCMECGVHLDKNCAEAPAKMVHPFHRKHDLNLLTNPPNGDGGNLICCFCNSICDKFVYHCSCDLIFHIKCALLSFKFLQKSLRESQPQLVRQNSRQHPKIDCFACREPVLDSDCISFDPGFYLHKKCFESPLEINHLSHRNHSLFLQFNTDRLPCKICLETQHQGLVYCCSICRFVLHIQCVSPPLTIENPSSHEHPFIRCLRDSLFNCDACGGPGNHVSYSCSTCSLVIHNKCISLPRFIKHVWHEHPIRHEYFVVDNESTTQDRICPYCHEEVNTACGSYYCSKCKFIIHVHCALREASWYYKIESKDEFESSTLEADTTYPSFFVTKTIQVGENVIPSEIKHFSHQHHLVLSDQVKNQTYCDCCSRLITSSFYGCFDCVFSLHKSCVELPQEKKIIGVFHQDSHELIPNCIFECICCHRECSGFGYKCNVYSCNDCICVGCAGISFSYVSKAHGHILLLYNVYNGPSCCKCCGLGTDGYSVYRCKACDFNVHVNCISRPEIVWHKFDIHGLVLTYHEDNDYSEYMYCDICEGERSPGNWFYHCAICDNSTHLDCVYECFPFMKRGIKIKEEDHPHVLVLVQKVHDYPERCCECGLHCSDLALECSDAECKYIIHFGCSKTIRLIRFGNEIVLF